MNSMKDNDNQNGPPFDKTKTKWQRPHVSDDVNIFFTSTILQMAISVNNVT